jgi:hypothetical protein
MPLPIYIYDDFGDLVCVIPPQAVKLMTQTTSQYFGKTEAQKEDFLKRWTFRYRYDTRRRMIQKQAPGAGQVYTGHRYLKRNASYTGFFIKSRSLSKRISI